MRYTRIITAFVLTASLILLLAFSVFAEGGETQNIIISYIEGEYQSSNYVLYSPTSIRNGRYIFANIKQNVIEDDQQKNLMSASILGYAENAIVDWQQGYIYTFNYQVTISGINPTNIPTFTLGISTLSSDQSHISLYQPLGDCTYTYSSTNNSASYSITCVVEVNENFDNGGIENYNRTFITLSIANSFLNADSTIIIDTSNITVNKAIGEDAYYQASLDAIHNLPQSEYGFIYNSMPNAEGEIDVIQGEILDVLSAYDTDIQQLVAMLNVEESRPCLYLPEVHLPFLDVHIWDNHIFYFDDYLNSMNSQIMVYINTFVTFIRFVLFITFVTVTSYKLTRIEWWY